MIVTYCTIEEAAYASDAGELELADILAISVPIQRVRGFPLYRGGDSRMMRRVTDQYRSVYALPAPVSAYH